MNYTLLALDVDGTILDSQHQLRPRVAQAIRAMRAAGAHIALATGKQYRSIQPLLERLGLDGPQICLNGAAINEESARHATYFAPLADDDRRAVIETVRAAGEGFLISQFGLDTIHVDVEHPALAVFEEYGEQRPTIVPDLLGVQPTTTGKILVAGAPERIRALREIVTPLLGARVYITTTMPEFLEFFHLDANKGHALARLRADLGVVREEVIAIGDGENDLPLLNEAGLAVAMANGAEVTRAAASRIAPTNDDDGVAVILEDLLRGGAS